MDALVIHRGRLAVASVVWHELHFGVERLPASRRRDYLASYLESVVRPTCEVLPYDAPAARWHARERSRLEAEGRTPSFADGQIAAIAAVNGCVLVTRNVADFSAYEGLAVENWFEPRRPD